MIYFTWDGKEESIKEAKEPTNKKLEPCVNESVNFDTTENLYIEGDNIDALKLLMNEYKNKVKMIYIDPPYNTGKNMLYNDKYGDKYCKHTNWLNMMYPRLILARDLLSDDGVIFISIDDNEVANLKKICDEIFGNENFINCLTIIRHAAGAPDSKFYGVMHDYALCYSKKINNIVFKCFELTEEQKMEFKNCDEIGYYKEIALQRGGGDSKREDRPNLYYPIYYNSLTNKLSLENDMSNHTFEITPKLSNGEDGRWRWGKEKFLQCCDTELFVKNINGLYKIYAKIRLNIGIDEQKTMRPGTLFYNNKYLSIYGSKIVKVLFNDKIFLYPKSHTLIIDFMRSFVNSQDLILDFFSGSATTAHAVMQLNAEDGGKRKFIMVQIPEKCDEKTEAYKAGYKNICEIGKERIRRAGKKIKEEFGDKAKDLDIGFRVFKIV